MAEKQPIIPANGPSIIMPPFETTPLLAIAAMIIRGAIRAQRTAEVLKAGKPKGCGQPQTDAEPDEAK